MSLQKKHDKSKSSFKPKENSQTSKTPLAVKVFYQCFHRRKSITFSMPVRLSCSVLWLWSIKVTSRLRISDLCCISNPQWPRGCSVEHQRALKDIDRIFCRTCYTRFNIIYFLCGKACTVFTFWYRRPWCTVSTWKTTLNACFLVITHDIGSD